MIKRSWLAALVIPSALAVALLTGNNPAQLSRTPAAISTYARLLSAASYNSGDSGNSGSGNSGGCTIIYNNCTFTTITVNGNNNTTGDNNTVVNGNNNITGDNNTTSNTNTTNSGNNGNSTGNVTFGDNSITGNMVTGAVTVTTQ